MIAMLRPTLSTSLYVQIVGRGNAIGARQGTIVWCSDFAGNVRRHGPVDAVSVLPGAAARAATRGRWRWTASGPGVPVLRPLPR